VDIRTGAIMSVEALLRWRRGDNGLILPDEFIPVAEETGLIIPIGEWVLNEACTQLAEWCQADKNPIGMAVNLSLIQFTEEELPLVVKRIVEHSGINPQLLTLEFTGSTLIRNIEGKSDMVKRLKDLGFKLAINDFGTGFFSLNYLRRFLLDELKIDRSFLADVTGDSKARALVSSVIYLSRKLGLLTVAEGVETKEQLDFLEKERCDQYQGDLFSPPLTNSELFELLPLKR